MSHDSSDSVEEPVGLTAAERLLISTLAARQEKWSTTDELTDTCGDVLRAEGISLTAMLTSLARSHVVKLIDDRVRLDQRMSTEGPLADLVDEWLRSVQPWEPMLFEVSEDMYGGRLGRFTIEPRQLFAVLVSLVVAGRAYRTSAGGFGAERAGATFRVAQPKGSAEPTVPRLRIGQTVYPFPDRAHAVLETGECLRYTWTKKVSVRTAGGHALVAAPVVVNSQTVLAIVTVLDDTLFRFRQRLWAAGWNFWDVGSTNLLARPAERLRGARASVGSPLLLLAEAPEKAESEFRRVVAQWDHAGDGDWTVTVDYLRRPVWSGAGQPEHGEPRPRGPILLYCSACGRGLSDPESVRRGVGPSCWEQLQAADRERWRRTWEPYGVVLESLLPRKRASPAWVAPMASREFDALEASFLTGLAHHA